MFVLNAFTFNSVYETKNPIVAKYLIKNGVPLLTKESGTFIFSETKMLQDLLKASPFYVRIFL
jgi:hypothetical protein